MTVTTLDSLDEFDVDWGAMTKAPRKNLALLPNIFFDPVGDDFYRRLLIPEAYPNPNRDKALKPSFDPDPDEDFGPNQGWGENEPDDRSADGGGDPTTDPGYTERDFELDAQMWKDPRDRGNSEGYDQCRCERKPCACKGWADVDKGRWHRSNGEHGEGSRSAGRADYDGSKLYQLHVETNGGWHVDRHSRVSRPQLEVCRRCGSDLGLVRDPDGYVIRGFGTQRQYCSVTCIRGADNQHDRYRYHGGKWPRDRRGWHIGGTSFDLDSITVAGVGRLGIPPAGWSRENPRGNPELIRPRPGRCRDVFTLALHEYVMKRRNGRFRGPSIPGYQIGIKPGREGQNLDLALTGTTRVHRWRDSPARRYTPSLIRKQRNVWSITPPNRAPAC